MSWKKFIAKIGVIGMMCIGIAMTAQAEECLAQTEMQKITNTSYDVTGMDIVRKKIEIIEMIQPDNSFVFSWMDRRRKYEAGDKLKIKVRFEEKEERELKAHSDYSWRDADWPDWLSECFMVDVNYPDEKMGMNIANVSIKSVLYNANTFEYIEGTEIYYQVGSFEYKIIPTWRYSQEYDYSLQMGENVLGKVSELKYNEWGSGAVSAYYLVLESGEYCVSTKGSQADFFSIVNASDEEIIDGGKGMPEYYNHTVYMEKGKVYRFTYADFENFDGIFTINIMRKGITPVTSEIQVNHTEEIDGNTYKVTTAGNKPEVALIKISKSKANVTIPSSVTIQNKSCRVTAIGDKAFAGNKKLKKVVIEKNIKRIGKRAFYGCKRLKSIVVKSKKLTVKSVAAKAFQGVPSSASIKVPRAKRGVYKKIFRAKGLRVKVKIK